MRFFASTRCSPIFARAATGWPVIVLAGAGAACTRTVVLGSECPEQRESCLEAVLHPAGPAEDAVAPLSDAGDPGHGDTSALADAQPADSAQVEPVADPIDARVDSPSDASNPLVALAVDNPSFERGGGLPGDVLLVNLVETLVPLPPVTWALTTLPNWYACVPLSVSSESREQADAGTGGPAGDYVAFVTNGSTVRQALASPMNQRSQYHFALDVISRSEGSHNLFVEVRGARQQCGDGTILGRSALLQDQTSWTSTCVSFTASEPFTHLLIGPGWQGSQPPLGARLLIDNLRQVDHCDP